MNNMSFRDLPNDLQEEILSHIPTTNLKRLRSTCKQWNHLFNNRSFARKHLDKAAKEFKTLMVTHQSRILPLSFVNLPAPSLEVKSELTLIDPISERQFDFYEVFHCDGLLLCYYHRHFFVVWNPCTGQTRWLKAGTYRTHQYALGYSKSSSSYKVLTYCFIENFMEIYDFSSESWRRLDNDIIPQGWNSGGYYHMVSLHGNSYYFARDKLTSGIYLLKFDFSSEKSSIIARLPGQTTPFYIMKLSVVRGDKLSVLLSHRSKTELWVTNTINDDKNAKAVSWNKVDLSSGHQISNAESFLVDEEKKVGHCERLDDGTDDKGNLMGLRKIYCVGEDCKVTQVYYRHPKSWADGPWPTIHSYVPSLVKIT